LLPDRVPDLHIERAVAAFESHATPSRLVSSVPTSSGHIRA